MTGALHIGHALTAAIEVPLYTDLIVCESVTVSLRLVDLIRYLLHAGYYDSLAENVWI